MMRPAKTPPFIIDGPLMDARTLLHRQSLRAATLYVLNKYTRELRALSAFITLVDFTKCDNM